MPVSVVLSPPSNLFSSALVSLFISMTMQKTNKPIFTNVYGKCQVAHGPQKKPLDFGGNPDHVTLGLGLE